MKRLLALLMLGALLIPAVSAYYPSPTPSIPEFAKKINGEWSDLANPVTLEGLHYCETLEVEVWALFFKDLYAYEFTLTWDVPGYISLVDAEVKHIHTADFVIIGGEGGINNTLQTYTQAVTAIAPAEGWGDGTQMAAIANLFFHIDNDAQWPTNVTITFCFGPNNDQTKASDSCTTPITHLRQRAWLLLEPCQPTISALPPVVYKSVVGDTFEMQFQIECAVKMKSFHFIVTWDPVQLKTDAQNVFIKDFLPPPYESTFIGFPAPGVLEIDVQMPCEKPLRNGTGELFGIRFTALNPWPDAIPDYYEKLVPKDHPIWYPYPCYNYINIAGYIDKDVSGTVYQFLGDPAGVTVKGPDIAFDASVPPMLIAGGFDADNDTKFVYDHLCPLGGFIVGYYEFRPIPGDLNLDGHVDIEDLSAVAKAYGLPNTMDINGDGIVDIFDVVIVAKNFCRTEPDPNLPWPIQDP